MTLTKKFFFCLGCLAHRFWWIELLLVKLLGVWFSLIIGLSGETLHFISNGKMTGYGWAATVFIIAINILITFSSEYAKKVKAEERTSQTELERNILQRVCEGSVSVCGQKIDSQIDALKIFRRDRNTIPKVYTNPQNQIKILLDQIIECFCTLLAGSPYKFSKNDFHLSLLYCYPEDDPDEWEFASYRKPISVEPKEIMKPGSGFTARHLIDTKSSYVFFNSKQKATQNSNYVPDTSDTKDSDNNIVGSIICILLEFGDVQFNCIRSILTISVTGSQLVSEIKETENGKRKLTEQELKVEKENLYNNIYKNIICNFKNRIGVELCNLYISQLKAKAEQDENVKADVSTNEMIFEDEEENNKKWKILKKVNKFLPKFRKKTKKPTENYETNEVKAGMK